MRLLESDALIENKTTKERMTLGELTQKIKARKNTQSVWVAKYGAGIQVEVRRPHYDYTGARDGHKIDSAWAPVT